jgi:hypothetical protein
MRERLGDRIPLMPPIGEAYIAGQSLEVVERWLSKSSSQEPDVIEKYRQRLELVAARGAALATIAPGGEAAYRELHDAMFEYSSGALTPARERAVRAVIARMSTFFATVDLTDGELYDVGSVVVPVHNPEGDISMVVRLTQLPRGVSGRTVEAWVSRLKEAAAAIEGELHRNGGAAQLEDYRAWYPSEFPM